MGIFDKAKDFASNNPDKAEDLVNKAGDMVDERTGGQYADKVDQAQDFARGQFGGGQAPAGEPAGEPGAPAGEPGAPAGAPGTPAGAPGAPGQEQGGFDAPQQQDQQPGFDAPQQDQGFQPPQGEAPPEGEQQQF